MADPIQKDVDYAEPCVSVEKMRYFGDNEKFEPWCIKHHHWLNGAPAKPVVDSLIASVRGRSA